MAKRRYKTAPGRLGKWVVLVREDPTAYERKVLRGPSAGAPKKIVELLTPRLAVEDGEVMIVVSLNSQNKVLALTTIAKGGVSALSVTAREIFRVAIAEGASGIVLVHNHPSGSTDPSPADLAMTRRVKEAGKLLGIPLLDHVIIAGSSSYTSLLEADLL